MCVCVYARPTGLFEQYLTDARNLARTWLDTSINFTAELLPEADSSSSDEDEAIKVRCTHCVCCLLSNVCRYHASSSFSDEDVCETTVCLHR